MSHWQRKHRRVPFAFRVRARWNDSMLCGSCQRMATMGLYVYHHDPLPLDAEPELELELPLATHEPIIARGKVRRSDPESPAENLLGGMQILFTQLGEEQGAALERFVSSCIEREAEYLQMGPPPGDCPLPHYEIRYFGTGSSRAAYVEDISEGGVLIRTLNPDAKGSRVLLSLYLPGGQPRHVGGTVVWSRPHDPAEPGKAGMGIQFTDIEPDAQQMIASFVAHFGEEVQVPEF